MNIEKFKSVYNESRNGANRFIRHALVYRFIMSDGAYDLAETGCHWLMDIAATELPSVLVKKREHMGILSAVVKKGIAHLAMTGTGDVRLWQRRNINTDLPDGDWKWCISNSGDGQFICILLSEY